MRRAARKDENQNYLAAYLVVHGALVEDVHALGDLGFDLLVVYRGSPRAVEVKNPALPPSKRKLTPNEIAAQIKWGPLYAVIETEQDCDQMLKEMRE